MAGLRPLEWVSEQELRHFTRRRTPVYRAWAQLRDSVGRRDSRGFSLWGFALGWLACSQYHAQYYDTLVSRLNAAHEAELLKMQVRYEKEAGIKLLKESKYE